MAKPQAMPSNVDLFGNSTLTPRQVRDQQIASVIENARQTLGGSDSIQQLTSMSGGAIGGLFRQVMMDSGMIPKDPEQERAEKMGVAREAINKAAKDSGVDISKDPEAYASLAVKHFLDAGMEPEAFKALQVGQIFNAQKRAIALENSKIEENKAQTEKAKADARKANAEADALPVLSNAKLDLLKNQSTLAKVKAEGLKVLTALKATDPNRAKVKKFNSIIDEIESSGGEITPVQRKILDELKGFDPINKLLGQILGGAGPAVDMSDTPKADREVMDFTGSQ